MKNLTNQIAKPARTRRGFTLLELLIAVVIIGILVAIIVPVLSNRANEARHTAALKDLDSLTTAEEHVAIDTGYFVRLHVLDDTRYGDTVANNTTTDRINGIRDEQFALASNTANGANVFIDTSNDVEEPPNLASTVGNLEKSSLVYNRAIRNETQFGWNGPYVNVMKQAGQAAPWIVFSPEIVTYGNPVDPWGSPYLFFNRRGLMDERSKNNSGLGEFLTDPQYRIFDRPTIVSLGPNGLPGDGTTNSPYGAGDDLYKQF